MRYGTYVRYRYRYLTFAAGKSNITVSPDPVDLGEVVSGGSEGNVKVGGVEATAQAVMACNGYFKAAAAGQLGGVSGHAPRGPAARHRQQVVDRTDHHHPAHLQHYLSCLIRISFMQIRIQITRSRFYQHTVGTRYIIITGISRNKFVNH